MMASVVEDGIRSIVKKGLMGVAKFNAARKSRDDDNPYLTGIHKPMDSEETLIDLSVAGEIPKALNGRYLRIGPNPVTPPNPAAYHWFTGDGMVHGIRIKGGKALWYRNRWIRSETVSNALDEPLVSAPDGIERGTVNTNIIGHAGRFWALVEAGNMPAELDGECETIAINPFDDTLNGPFSAHPHRDPDSGELHAICYRGDSLDTIWHKVVDVNGKIVREEPVSVEHGPSIHDCTITPSYVVILDLPVTFSMKMMLGGAPFPYHWNPAHKARVGLLPRNGSNADVIWYDVDPCYVFHTFNAFEEQDGTVVIDAPVHNRMFAGKHDGPDGSKITVQRWRLAPGATSIAIETIDDTAQEFPRFDERRAGKPYRFAYTMALENPAGTDGLISDTRLFRHDLEKGMREIHDFGPGRHPGEFVFEAYGEGEEEGWLIGLVVNMNNETTDLVILDAASFESDPVAQIRLPHRVPPGFHGNWVNAGDAAS